MRKILKNALITQYLQRLCSWEIVRLWKAWVILTYMLNKVDNFFCLEKEMNTVGIYAMHF